MRLAAERLHEVVLDLELLADRLVVVRVDDPPVLAPDLEARDLALVARLLERRVEHSHARGVHAGACGEVVGTELAVRDRAGEELRRRDSVLERTVTDLVSEELRERDAENGEAHEAQHRELPK